MTTHQKNDQALKEKLTIKDVITNPCSTKDVMGIGSLQVFWSVFKQNTASKSPHWHPWLGPLSLLRASSIHLLYENLVTLLTLLCSLDSFFDSLREEPHLLLHF